MSAHQPAQAGVLYGVDMNIFTLDFETFWNSKDYTLSKMGPIEYVRDSRFVPQMVGVACNNAPVVVATSSIDEQRRLLGRINCGSDVVVGHNMSGFDALILSEYFGLKPQRIWDTICMMRWCGISSISRERLAALDEVLGIGEKKAGTVVSDGKGWPNDFTEEEQAFFAQYCADDVDQCRRAVALMLPYMTADALRFISLTARMATEPVFVLDEQMLEEYLKQLDAEAEEARLRIMELFHFETVADFLKALRSKEKFASMLRELGVEPPMKMSEKRGVMDYAFSKQDIDFLDLREHEDSRVRLLVETRLEFNSSVLRSRCETLLKFARYKKPLPIILSAFKAHTSRYTASANGEHRSDSIQVQNLSKRNPAHLVLRKSIKVPEGYKIVSADSSQIEARVNSWFCNEAELVEQFRAKRDPYAELAEKFNYGHTAKEIHDGAKAGDKHMKMLRNVGKLGVLSAGYSVGAKKFADSLWKEKVKLDADYDKHCEMAFAAHAIYRQSNPNIVSMWETCQRVIEALAAGQTGRFGGPNNDLMEYGVFPIIGRNDLAVPTVKSPSGFHLRYPGLRATVTDNGKVEYVYDRFLGRNRVAKRIYGGLLLENIIQHLAFQILVFQACRMDEDGIALKCNIHDSWATVVPESEAEATAEKMLYWMRQKPAWADGCPINAEVEIGDDFTVV